jgi:hypothetical protein
MVVFRCVFLVTLVLLCSSKLIAVPVPYHVVQIDQSAAPRIRGIYINYSTILNTKRLHELANEAQAVGINAFVIDYVPRSPRYRENVKWVESQGIRYISRIVMYPGGGTHEQLTSKTYLNNRMIQINDTINLGAKIVQLDYIRYNSRNSPSPENAKIVAGVLEDVKENLRGRDVDLHIDIFGIAAHRPSVRIGQDVTLMAQHVDGISPMVYPSHYEPYEKHSKNPYQTIYASLSALTKQLEGKANVQVYPFIEAYNFRYPMNKEARVDYIREQLRAVRESQTSGWLVWSANNHYENLFAALRL